MFGHSVYAGREQACDVYMQADVCARENTGRQAPSVHPLSRAHTRTHMPDIQCCLRMLPTQTLTQTSTIPALHMRTHTYSARTRTETCLSVHNADMHVCIYTSASRTHACLHIHCTRRCRLHACMPTHIHGSHLKALSAAKRRNTALFWPVALCTICASVSKCSFPAWSCICVSAPVRLCVRAVVLTNT
jgi:hypothetical protein